MKKTNTLLICGFFIIFFSACKWSGQPDELIVPFMETEAPSEFNWKTQNDLKLKLSSSSGGTVQVRAADDEEEIYLWANLQAGETSEFNISVPSYRNELTIRHRDKEVNVDITDDELDIQFL